MYLNPKSVKFIEMQRARKNEIKVLTSFYYELERQRFSLKVYDGELYKKINSLDDILAFHSDLDEMSIHVERNDFRAVAHFIFGCGEFVLYCMYDYSSSLKGFINETLVLMETLANETLANERCERLGLDY